jgi:hypothetical protein
MKKKPPLYTLPHGIEVIGEYAPSGKNRYWRARIRPHPFFPKVRNRGGGIMVRRSRVILAAKLGRALTPDEHAHHGRNGCEDDSLKNLSLLTAADHNRHHKVGFKHSSESKKKISASLKLAIAEGRREPPPRVNWTGRKHSQEARKKMSATKQAKRLEKMGILS